MSSRHRSDAGAERPGGGGSPASGGWPCLIVDDEPAIHEITKLVLSNARFAGRDVEFHSAHSAAEARAFLQHRPDTALVLLDVVMETEDAGLGLVRHIRDVLGYADMQVVLRTGQPGMAPERDVILNYDINGYYLKTEITAQKLHSLVIAALRTYQTLRDARERGSRGPGDPGISARSTRRHALQAQLLDAVGRSGCHFTVQPEVEFGTDQLAGLVLVPNWRTEEGLLGMSQVAEILQDGPLRLELDRRLLRHASGWIRSWSSSAGTPVRVSVPMLGDWVLDGAMFDEFEECLERCELDPHTLDLEVPVDVLLRKLPSVRSAIDRLGANGITMTVSNFGAGMISLPVLYRLQPARIKIHRTYVRNVASDGEKAAIARAVIALGHTLGMGVVADGIVDDLDRQFMKWEGCDAGQGDLLARSLAIADVANFLEARRDPTH